MAVSDCVSEKKLYRSNDVDFFRTILAWMLASALLLFSSTVPAPPGDLAPRFNTDGLLNAADYLVLQRMVLGDITPTPEELLAGDVAPLGSTDGVLNAADLVVLMRAISGEITLDQDPVASAGGPYISSAGSLVSFDGAGSYDPDGFALTYDWDFGDGNQGAGVTPAHIYSGPGTYIVTLVVNDGVLNSAATTATVTVNAVNQAPTSDPGGPYSAQVSAAVSFDGSNSSDPENDVLSYSWDFGDANQGAGVSPSHSYVSAGTYTVTLTVDDGTSTSTSTTYITVSTTDTDNDGMPDSWEINYGLDPAVNDAGADPDFDGITNLQEYQNGTNPTSANGAPDSNSLLYLGTQVDLQSFNQFEGIVDVAVDKQGNVYIAGYNQDDQSTLWHLMRMNADGSMGWKLDLGTGTYDTITALALDDAGDIYAVRTHTGLIKVRALDGVITNSYYFNGRTNDIQISNNQIYITGRFSASSNGGLDAYVSKLDINLNFVWSRSFGGVADDFSNSLSVAPNGDVYVSGGFEGTVNFNEDVQPVDPSATLTAAPGGNDFFVVKFTSTGDFVWAVNKPVGSFLSDNEVGFDVGVDENGNVHVMTLSAVLNGYAVYQYTNAGGYIGFTEYNANLRALEFSQSIGFSVYAGDFSSSVNFDPGGSGDTLSSNGTSDGFVRIADSNNYRLTIGIGGADADRVKAVNISDSGLLTIVGRFKGSVDFDYGPGTDIYTESGSPSIGAGVFITRYMVYGFDTDMDGMPDAWETEHGLDPNDDTDASIDSDGDGASNLNEYLGGSDPTNINSCLGTGCNVSVNPEPSPHIEPIPAPSATSVTLGSIGGKFRVDESGSASYSIPIYKLPGVAGVAPEISLNYSSQAGNGLLGKGWSIGGLSEITRCRETLAQDQQTKPLDLIDTPFCLDGQRLILETGEYGENGSTYKTEIDSFAEITAVSQTLPGFKNPGYFRVERKDGSVAIYTQLVTNSNTLSWGISSITDSTGQNSIGYSYEIFGQQAQDVHSIKEITYGSNSGYKVVFTYEDRYDVNKTYMAGLEMVMDKRLSSISVYNGGAEVRKYNLAYKPTDQAQPLTRLESIEECVGTVCLPKTTFTWSDAVAGFGQKNIMAFSGDSEERYIAKPIDINGDSNMDLLFTSTDYQSSDVDHWLYYATSDGTQLQVAGLVGGYELPESSPFAFHVLDYNGDGYQDVMRGNGGEWVVHLSDGVQLASTPVSTQIPSINQDTSIVVDFNADGLPDILYDKGNANYGVRYMEQVESPPSSGTLVNQFNATEYSYDFSSLLSQIPLRTDEPGTAYSQNGYISWQRKFEGFEIPRVADFNGDGRVDVVAVINSYYWIQNAFLNDPEIVDVFKTLVIVNIEQDGTFSVGGELPIQSYRWTSSLNSSPEDAFDAVPIDLNNDGLTDLITKVFSGNIDEGNYTTRVYLNHGSLNGNASFVLTQDLGVIPKAAYMAITDYNHDGFQDLLYPPGWDSDMEVRLWSSVNDSFIQATTSNLHFTGKLANIPRLKVADSYIFMDINADGYDDAVHLEFTAANPSGERAVYPSNMTGQIGNVITGINNGFGNQTIIGYAALTDGTVYTEESDAMQAQWSLPAGSHTLGKIVPGGSDYLAVFDLKIPTYVVKAVDSTAPAAGVSPGNVNNNALSRISYQYTGAKAQAGGRGLLGFHKIQTTDEQTGVETTTTYRQDYPFIGYPLETETWTGPPTAGGQLISRTQNTWQLQGWDGVSAPPAPPYRTFLQQEVAETYDLNGAELLSTVTTTSSYDDAGNVLNIIINTQDHVHSETYTKDTTNQYGLTAYDKRFGRLSHSEVLHSRTGVVSLSRVSDFTYYPGGNTVGLLHQEIVEPGSVNQLTTSYEYDGRGNKTRVTQLGDKGKNGTGGLQSRYKTFVYDSNEHFITNVTDGRGNSEYRVLARNAIGQPLQERDISGVVTDIAYGPFGREYFRRDTTGSFVSTQYLSSHADCPTGSQYAVAVTEGGGSQSLTCFDTLGREILIAKPLLDGTWTAVNTEYDSLGRVKHKSNPHLIGTVPSEWTTMHYDILGRVTQIDHPVNPDYPAQSTSTNSYDDFTILATNRKGQTRTEHKNALDEVIGVTDDAGGGIAYDYDAVGDLTGTTTSGPVQANGVPASITTSMAYDEFGNKVSMDDPDQGHWEYDYNAFGELVEQRDNAGQVVQAKYDNLGRIEERIDLKSGGSTEARTIWTYISDIYSPGLTKLSEVRELQTNFAKQYTYDGHGRISETVTSIPGAGEHYEKTTYDEYGRVFQEFDSAGNYNEGNYTGSEYRYNGFGYLTQILDVDVLGAAQAEYYSATAMDVWGNVTQESLSSGAFTVSRNYNPVTGFVESITTTDNSSSDVQDLDVQSDVLGNVVGRTDNIIGHTETFGYDGLNRMITSQVLGQPVQTITYDSFGNIMSKTGTGTYTYGNANAGPHAVSSTQNASTTIDYSYDTNGNLASDTNGRSLDYSTYNKPITISKGGHTTTFAYDHNRHRYNRTDNDGSGATTTLYVGKVEKLVYPDGSTDIRQYVSDNTLNTIHYDAAGKYQSTSTDVLLKDHLGSVDVIVSGGGATVPLAYDAWGYRRDATTGQNLTEPALANFDQSTTNRGYTGHEMLDKTGLVHMNGRVYDPGLGRFTSADNVIQDPKSTQNYNLYTYVGNNPQSHVDPSGHFIQFIGPALAAYVGASVAQGIFGNYGGILVSIVGCASGNIAVCTGVTTGATYTATGDFKTALKAGALSWASASAFDAIGTYYTNVAVEQGFPLTGSQTAEKIALHAAVGGVMNTLQGGKFGHGFVSAGTVNALSGPISRIRGPVAYELQVASVAIVGGTVSEITGGKFANGAITGAFSYIFNECRHRNCLGGKGPNDLGRRGVGEVIQRYAALGYEIVDVEVVASLPGTDYTRRYDFVTRSLETGGYIGVEVKATEVGLFRLDTRQVNFDAAVVSEPSGAIVKNADYRITGVRYDGADFSSRFNARWQQGYLYRRLQFSGIQPKTTIGPPP